MLPMLGNGMGTFVMASFEVEIRTSMSRVVFGDRKIVFAM